MRLWILVVFSLICQSVLHASSGTEGAAFLDIPVGAGPAALGSAYTAQATDAYAPVWNPAGLGFLEHTEFAAQHLSYLESMHHEFISIVRPFTSGKAIGISAQYLGSGDISGTDPVGNPTGDFSSHYGAYTAAYGQRLTDHWSLGVAGKWINAKLADVSANAVGVDFGTLCKVRRDLQLAMTVTNLGGSLKFNRQRDPLPRALHVGAAYAPNRFWTLSSEGVYSFSGFTSARLGVEWSPMDLVGIRAGYKTETTKGLSSLAGLSVGMGIKVWGHELAYAWLPYGDLGDSQYISLLMRFGEALERKRNLIQYRSIKEHRSVRQTPSRDESETPEYRQLMELATDEPERNALAPMSPK